MLALYQEEWAAEVKRRAATANKPQDQAKR